MSKRKRSRRRRRRLRAWGVFAAIVVALLTGAWIVTNVGGGSLPPVGPDALVELVDITLSTDNDRDDYLEDMTKVVDYAALNREPVYADAFDGNPRARVTWRVQHDFATIPPYYRSNPDLVTSYLEGQAHALTPRLRALTAMEAVRRGTPLGATLKLAADLCAQQHAAELGCRVFIFTDGEFIGEGIDSRREIDPADQRTFVDAWAPRLGGLAGATVTFVGVGHGIGQDPGLDDARAVAQALVRDAGGTMAPGDAGWAVRLGTAALP
jgi:hypothetical protein